MTHPWKQFLGPPFLLASNESCEGHDKEREVLLVDRARTYGPLLGAVVRGLVTKKVATCWVYNRVYTFLVRAVKPGCSGAEVGRRWAGGGQEVGKAHLCPPLLTFAHLPASPIKRPLTAQTRGDIGHYPLTMDRRLCPSIKAKGHVLHIALPSKAPLAVLIEYMWAKRVSRSLLADTSVSSIVEPMDSFLIISERPPHPKQLEIHPKQLEIGESFSALLWNVPVLPKAVLSILIRALLILALWTVPVLPKAVVFSLIRVLSGVILIVFAQDPLLYLLLVVETTLAVGRNFLEQHDQYFRTILSQDPSHYDDWLDKGARRPLSHLVSHLVFLPGVLPWAPQEKAKEEQVGRKRGTISSFLKNSPDWEPAMKWRPYRAMWIPVDTLIIRKDFCQWYVSSVLNQDREFFEDFSRCDASSVIKQEIEFFASVQSTQRLLDSASFYLGYYFLVKGVYLLVQVAYIIVTAL